MAYKSVWDALIGELDETDGLKRRSDYLILIQVRLHGIHGDGSDKSECCGLPIDQVRD